MLSQNNKLVEDKLILERNVNNLSDTRASQKIEISKLVEDNQKLVRLVSDNESTIKSLEADRIKQMSRTEEVNFNLKNTIAKLNSREENLNYTQKLLEDAKASIGKMQITLKEYEKNLDNFRADNISLNLALQKEKSTKLDSDKRNNQLEILLAEREREIGRLISEQDALRITNNRISEEKYILSNENDKLKNHIMTLTEQNQGVTYS